MKLFTYGDSWTSGDGISKHLNQKKYMAALKRYQKVINLIQIILKPNRQTP